MKKSLYKKGLVLGIIALFVASGVIPSIGGIIVERHVTEDIKTPIMDPFSRGNILYVGGSGPNNYTSIQEAINDANNGDTIFVYNDSSPYFENIIINKSINLVGEDRDSTAITGGNGNIGLNGLGYDPITDKLYGASGISLYEINMDFGNQIYIGDFNTGGSMIAISFDNIGNCYGVDIGTDSLYSIDTSSGEASCIGSFGIDLNYAQDCAYDRDNDIFYLSSYRVDTDYRGVDDYRAPGERISRNGGELYICDTETANLTLVGAFENSAEITGFAIPYTQVREFDRRFGLTKFPNKFNFRESRYEPFYGYCAYDPGGKLNDYTISFNCDSPEKIKTIAPTQSNNFITGATWVKDTWYGVEYYTGQLYIINPYTGDMNPIGYNKETIGVSADWVNISKFSIYDTSGGIYIHSNFNNITGNRIIDNWNGIELDRSSNNTIHDNIISSNNDYGIRLSESINNIIVSNTISNNGYYSDPSAIGIHLSSSNNNNLLGNFFFNDGLFVENSYHNHVENNTVNGKPLVYLEDESDKIITYAGQVILVNCDNITAENLKIINTYVGMQLLGTNNCEIRYNNCSNNVEGIYLYDSSNNNINYNEILSNNNNGINLAHSSNNTICENNIFSNNMDGIYLSHSSNNTISGNNITKNGKSLLFNFAHNNTIKGNNISKNGDGISLAYSNNNIISANNFLFEYESSRMIRSMYLYRSSSNAIIGNNFQNSKNSTYGLYLDISNNNYVLENSFFNDGLFVENSYHNHVENNTVNGKPLVYLEDESDKIITYAGQVILVNCDNITAENLNLTDTDVKIELWQTHNCKIENNDCSNKYLFIGYSIVLYKSHNNTFMNNIISGIKLYESDDNTIKGNNISHGGYGTYNLYLYKSINNTIKFNIIVEGFYCILLDDSSYNIIEGNEIVAVWSGVSIFHSNFNKIMGNDISDCGHAIPGGAGIDIGQSGNNIISGNNLSDNYVGIFLSSDSINNTITSNTLLNNSGLGISLGGYNNTISNNSFFKDGLWVHDFYHHIVENNTVNGKPIVYLENKSDEIITYAGQVILVNCDNITLNNLNISDTGVGIELLGTHNSKIINNNISNNWDGINLIISSNNTLRGNTISNDGWYRFCFGILLWSSSSNTISSNYISLNQHGIYIRDSSDNNITNNTITLNNVNGIEIWSPGDTCVNNIIHGNIISSNNMKGIEIYWVSSSIIIGNTISSNKEEGILLYGSGSNNIITDNIISKNKYGIHLYYGNNNHNTITGNTFLNNDYGIYSSGDCNDNIIKGNTISNNYYGIYLPFTSSNNVITDNIFSNNKNGIECHGSNSIIAHNTFSNNDNGTKISWTNNLIKNNTFSNNKNGVLLGGFNNIVTANTLLNNENGIYLYDSETHTIMNNYIYNNANGIKLLSSDKNNIISNKINSENENGIYLFHSHYNNVSGNIINRNKITGICLNSSSYNNVTNNNITLNHKNGIYLHQSNFNIINGNYIWNNENGIKFYRSNSNNIIFNDINLNKNNGIYFHNGDDNNISNNNIISNNDYGIYLRRSDINNITINNLFKNGIGVFIEETSTNNKIQKNNIIKNKRQAFFKRCEDNIWNQNYWNRPRILPKIIFGGIGKYALKLSINIDWHPAIKKYCIEVKG